MCKIKKLKNPGEFPQVKSRGNAVQIKYSNIQIYNTKISTILRENFGVTTSEYLFYSKMTLISLEFRGVAVRSETPKTVKQI